MNRPAHSEGQALAWQAGSFTRERGVHVLAQPPEHRDDDFDPAGFATLLAMQRNHFWYQGRHRLLLAVLQHELERLDPAGVQRARAIDLGGGCGGWIEYLQHRASGLFGELALGDSSLQALDLAGPVIGHFAQRYQVDLLNLGWEAAWDAVFLLDVIEHIGDDAAVLRQAARALRPGGLLIVTVPALQCFWTYNDVYARHQRRYSRGDFSTLAQACGLELVRAEYFMFFLSPVLMASRVLARPAHNASPAQVRATLARTHRVPVRPLNAMLAGLLAAEAVLVNRLRFPWGTSALAVLHKRELR